MSGFGLQTLLFLALLFNFTGLSRAAESDTPAPGAAVPETPALGTSPEAAVATPTGADSSALTAGGALAPNAVATLGAPVRKIPRSGGPREKDAEGTEAPNRFKADVIKSQYNDSHGQPFEVDTD